MVTKIVNNTDKDVVYYTQNINSLLTGKPMPYIKKVVKAGETKYDRAVTGNTETENYLTSQGCVLTQQYRNLWLIIAGQSNAVGYDETPWDQDDVGAIPYCYFEGLKGHGGYGNADPVPAVNAGIDAFQDMQNLGGVGTRTKSLAYPLAKELIGLIPDEYELFISNYSQGMSYVNGGVVGTITSSNIPEGSTRWNTDGNLTTAIGRRMNLHMGRIQRDSKFLGVVWCQGEADGQGNCSVENYKTAFNNTITQIEALFAGGDNVTYGNKTKLNTMEKLFFNEFRLDTIEAHDKDAAPENESAFVEFTGGTFVASGIGNWSYMLNSQFAKDCRFRTNLDPTKVDIKYSSTAPTITAGQDATAIVNDRADVCEVAFDELGGIKYRILNGITSAKMPIYVCFINKLNNKYMGYAALNWSSTNSIGTPAWTYAEANAKVAFKYPLWIVFPGPQKYWDGKGTFKQIIQWQKENFTGFVDLPKDLPTNNARATGTKARTWNNWIGQGFTSSIFDSHYGQNAYRYIAKKVAEKIKQMFALYSADQ